MDAQADQTADNGAVDPYVLEIRADTVLELLDHCVRIPAPDCLGDQGADIATVATRHLREQGAQATV